MIINGKEYRIDVSSLLIGITIAAFLSWFVWFMFTWDERLDANVTVHVDEVLDIKVPRELYAIQKRYLQFRKDEYYAQRYIRNEYNEKFFTIRDRYNVLCDAYRAYLLETKNRLGLAAFERNVQLVRESGQAFDTSTMLYYNPDLKMDTVDHYLNMYLTKRHIVFLRLNGYFNDAKYQ